MDSRRLPGGILEAPRRLPGSLLEATSSCCCFLQLQLLLPIAFVEGGYKAIRQHCIQRTEQLVAELPAIVLSGRTGTGKTRVLGDFPRYIDLEGLAHHRGSSFGKQLDPQPTQINFESALAAELIRLSRISSKAIAFEDESRLIGRCMMPECLQAKLKHSPILVLEDDMAARVERILDEYVIEATALRKQRFDNKQQAFDDLSASLTKSLHKIRKRLGGEAHQEALGLLTNALRHQSLTDNFEAHKDWILFLLQRYYDPMYDYQLSLKSQRVVIRGNATELKQWLQHHHPA